MQTRKAPRRGHRPAGLAGRADVPTFAIRVLEHPEWTAVLLRGELDLSSTRRLDRAVRAELARGRPVILELAGLDFVDPNGVRCLARLLGDACEFPPPADLEIHGARGQVADLIERVRGAADPI